MECLNKIKCNKYLLFENQVDAQAMLLRFEENYTAINPSKDNNLFAIYIKPIDRHKLTQLERETMEELPINFYGNIE